MELDAESLQRQIPSYLAAEDQEALVRELKLIAKGGAVEYLMPNRSYVGEMLQGDGWKDFQIFIFHSGERRTVNGIVLSNSCDIDPSNKRELPTRVAFAPLVRLANFVSAMEKHGIDQEKIKKKVASIKAQKTTNIFYIPAGGFLEDDYIARFDEVHSMPTSAHDTKKESKLFSLSTTGFYMFILKLSVHFCRLQENVDRKISANPA